MDRNLFSMTISKSKTLLIYFIVLHLSLFVMGVSLFGISASSLLFTLVLIISFIYYCRQYQWLSNTQSAVRIEQHADQTWTIYKHNKVSKHKNALKSSFVTPQIVILNFKRTCWWQSNSIMILKDAIDTDLFRLLRIICRDQ